MLQITKPVTCGESTHRDVGSLIIISSFQWEWTENIELVEVTQIWNSRDRQANSDLLPKNATPASRHCSLRCPSSDSNPHGSHFQGHHYYHTDCLPGPESSFARSPEARPTPRFMRSHASFCLSFLSPRVLMHPFTRGGPAPRPSFLE